MRQEEMLKHLCLDRHTDRNATWKLVIWLRQDGVALFWPCGDPSVTGIVGFLFLTWHGSRQEADLESVIALLGRQILSGRGDDNLQN